MLANSRRLLGIAIVTALSAVPLHAQVVISQVYGGGGNAGSTFRNDFIELFNRGSAPVDVTGWSVQYAATGGTTWQATALSGMIPPGQYYLVQEAQGTGGTVNLPTPDATGTIAMAAGAGKVALVTTTTLLSGSCPLGAGVPDFVGYGPATNCSETAPTTANLSATLAALRAGLGCTDTDNNAADFATGAPNPRNSSSPTNPCVGPLTITTSSPLPNATEGLAYSVTFAASGGTGTGFLFSQAGGTLPPGLMLTDGTLSGTPTTTTGSPFTFTIQVTDSGSGIAQKMFQLTVNPGLVCNPTSTIAQIQGSGDTSSLAGTVITTRGIVTGVKTNGFFIQMAEPGDGDPATSDGVFVFTSSAPPAAVAVGTDICVTGSVQEFIPSQDPSSPPATEISFTTSIFAISSGNPLPAAITLTAADMDPSSAIDNLEKYEGMRVHVDSLTTIAPTQGTINEPSATSTSNGTFYGVITGIARPFREPGIQVPDPLPSPLPTPPPTMIPRFDSNPERLRVDSDGLVGATSLQVTSNAVVTGLTGPLDFAFRTYTIDPDPGSGPVLTGNMSAIPAADALTTQYRIGGFNIERFFDTVNDPAIGEPVLTATAFNNRLQKLSLAIRNVLRSPDILGLEEVENLTTLQAVAGKINADAVAAGDANPNYVAYLEEGNDIGGIDVGFLVKSSRVHVVDVTQVDKDATYINPNNGQPELLNDRPSLVLRAEIPRLTGTGSVPVTVIVNHLRSLSGIDDPVDGNRVRTKRRAQAEGLANYVQSREVANPDEKLILVGDFNAFQINDGYVDMMGTIVGTPTPADQVTLASPDLVDPDLFDAFQLMPEPEQYSYSFDGNAQILDHALVNTNLLRVIEDAQYVRLDADFAESFRNDPTRPERISDHDPVLVTFGLPRATVTELTSTPNPSAFGEEVVFEASVEVVDGGIFGGVKGGTVTFKEGTTVLGGPFPIGRGDVVFSTTALSPGDHTITAEYSGTDDLEPSSDSVVQTVSSATTHTALVSAPNPSGFGQPVTFTATITAEGSPVTLGTVSFREGATALAGPIALDASGHASFTTADLGVGVHTVTADYSGAVGFDASTASVVHAVSAGLSVGDVVGKEGTGPGTTTFTFVVRLMPPAAVPVTVDVATANGTAAAGADYVATSTTVTFPPGATQQGVNVVVTHDNVHEADEEFFVRLTNPANATVVDGEGVGTILNDDPLPTLRVNNPMVKEGNSGTTAMTFQVKLSTASELPVTVSYQTADLTATAGSDYVATSGSLTFPPGTTSLPVVVNVKGDFVREPTEILFLQLSSPTNATLVYSRGIGFITNDDAAPTVTNFIPKHGRVGKVVTVYGSGFEGATAVTFAGVNALFDVMTDGRLKATVPVGAVTGPIEVMTVNGPAENAPGLPDFIVDP